MISIIILLVTQSNLSVVGQEEQVFWVKSVSMTRILGHIQAITPPKLLKQLNLF